MERKGKPYFEQAGNRTSEIPLLRQPNKKRVYRYFWHTLSCLFPRQDYFKELIQPAIFKASALGTCGMGGISVA